MQADGGGLEDGGLARVGARVGGHGVLYDEVAPRVRALLRHDRDPAPGQQGWLHSTRVSEWSFLFGLTCLGSNFIGTAYELNF